MYLNGKMVPVEIIPGMGSMRENSGGSESGCDLFDIL
jgi:hypothetical protein